MPTYQKQLPYNLRSTSLAWSLTVANAVPVAFLWYVFLEDSPPWLVLVILIDDAERMRGKCENVAGRELKSLEAGDLGQDFTEDRQTS